MSTNHVCSAIFTIFNCFIQFCRLVLFIKYQIKIYFVFVEHTKVTLTMVRKRCNSVPKRWLEYSAHGGRIPDTPFFPTKVPLRECINRKIAKEYRFSPSNLLFNVTQLGYTVGMVIDLTNSNRFYDPTLSFTWSGIRHVKLYTAGGRLPDENLLKYFYAAVDYFREIYYDRPDMVICVHCSNGVERTGYFMCRYLIDRMAWANRNAIDIFGQHRGHCIQSQLYLDALLNHSPPPTHSWNLPSSTRRGPNSREKALIAKTDSFQYIPCSYISDVDLKKKHFTDGRSDAKDEASSSSVAFDNSNSNWQQPYPMMDYWSFDRQATLLIDDSVPEKPSPACSSSTTVAKNSTVPPGRLSERTKISSSPLFTSTTAGSSVIIKQATGGAPTTRSAALDPIPAATVKLNKPTKPSVVSFQKRPTVNTCPPVTTTTEENAAEPPSKRKLVSFQLKKRQAPSSISDQVKEAFSTAESSP
ncbi:RNA/RNP complex-1-interacting phosphatase [Trichinella britovi]|uniref:RNA/RNP complex-1-interacting phosphatase n=1 Tax=Trichinella britovi TaxID=45882 RepID=A0A0V1CM71_TRIBR|nr:RNA/RNP complex-1-interacting phosphatase [Trichinella britovi]